MSRGLERDVQELARRFLVFETLRQDSQSQCLHFRDGFRLVGAVAEHSIEVRNLSDPPAILLEFELDLKNHKSTLARGAA